MIPANWTPYDQVMEEAPKEQEIEKVRLRRRTGFWAWASVVSGAVQFECSEEAFYSRAHRLDLCVNPGRRLKFVRDGNGSEMMEV